MGRRVTPSADFTPDGMIRSAVPLVLMTLIGVCAGAASSALILQDRVVQIIALWSH